jgi:hypothetical protein
VKKYGVSQFDRDTFVVFDTLNKCEICICGNYEGGTDAEKRAREIAKALNAQESQKSRSIRKAKMVTEGSLL